jgi:hypothetical protein
MSRHKSFFFKLKFEKKFSLALNRSKSYHPFYPNFYKFNLIEFLYLFKFFIKSHSVSKMKRFTKFVMCFYIVLYDDRTHMAETYSTIEQNNE